MTLKCIVLCSSWKRAEARSGPRWKKNARKPANNSNRSLEQRTEISASISGSWRGGITAIRARARFSSAKKTGPIVGFFGRARGFSRRRRTKLKRIRNRARLNRPKERHEQIRHKRRNHTLRAEICTPRRRRPFSGNAEAGALLSRNRHVSWATGHKNG